jgi:hypothetical protein
MVVRVSSYRPDDYWLSTVETDLGWECPECKVRWPWSKRWDYVTVEMKIMCRSCAEQRGYLW